MPDLRDIWSCPYCNTPFEGSFDCKNCGASFPVDNGRPDLRITRPVNIKLDYHYTPEFGYFPWEKVVLDWPSVNNGLVRQQGWENMEAAMLRSVPKPDKQNQLMALDIGCGLNRQRFKEGLTTLGYLPIGVDIDGPAPDALADGHCLPFRDETFDVIMSSAVFEHLKNPFVAMKEIYRVAKPGATIYLSIAFNEPFHISYFHHSPIAVHELLVTNNITPDKFILSTEWHSFRSNLHMGFSGHYMPPFMQRLVSSSIVGFSMLPARVLSIVKNNKEKLHNARFAFARSHSGAVGVIAHK